MEIKSNSGDRRGYLELTYTNKEIIFGQDVGELEGSQMEVRNVLNSGLTMKP